LSFLDQVQEDMLENIHFFLPTKDENAVAGENARKLAQRIPGARLEFIAGAHHYPQIERPEAFNSAVLAFLATLDDERR